MTKHTNRQAQLFSVKEIERAKLRQLRDEMAREQEGKKRRAEALRRAEQDESRWEVYRTGCVPLRGLR
jgi:hypothetical protein